MKKLLFAVIVFALLTRIVAINYGLPLWLVGDEPPFVNAALKMIELKTVIPALNEKAFKPILYFPPYLSYAYLIPFIILLGAKYILFSGTLEEFKSLIVSDPSQFFLIARLISVFLGTATVWLVYKISKNVFRLDYAAILSSFFLASSVIHVNLSSVGRDWAPAVFLFTLGAYIITNPEMSFKKRYLASSVVSGVAFGVSLVGGFLMLFMLFTYLLYEKNSILKALKEKILYASLIIFLALAVLSIIIYPFGFHLKGDHSLYGGKTISGLVSSPINFYEPAFMAEPILFIFAIAGLAFCFREKRNFFWASTALIISYAFIFYGIYYYQERFAVYMFPVFSILAGYGFYRAVGRTSAVFRKGLSLILLLLIPALTTMQFDRLAVKNDPRVQALHWIEKELDEGERVITYARLTRIPNTKGGVEEQGKIDSRSLRQIDHVEQEAAGKNFPPEEKHFHALNLYTVNNKSFYDNLPLYVKEMKYNYLLIDPQFPKDELFEHNPFFDVMKDSELITSFGEPGQDNSLAESTFSNPIQFLKIKSFGPRIEIYKLES